MAGWFQKTSTQSRKSRYFIIGPAASPSRSPRSGAIFSAAIARITKFPSIPLSIFIWKDVIRPLGILGFWGSLGAILLHYVTIGPKKIEAVDDDDKGVGHE